MDFKLNAIIVNKYLNETSLLWKKANLLANWI
jgi:hypothetical protein